MHNELGRALRAHMAMFEALREKDLSAVEDAATLWSDALRAGGKILLCGNGGSAADCQHIAAELVGRFFRERKALPAMALTVNTSNLTAIANDYSYDQVFARQMQAFGRPGDVAVGLSTSGNSPNVVNALEAAHAAGLATVAFTGRKGGKCSKVADLVIAAPSDETPRIQEMHITIGHIICALVEETLFEPPPPLIH